MTPTSTRTAPPVGNRRDEPHDWRPDATAASVALLLVLVDNRHAILDSPYAVPALATALGTAAAVLLARHRTAMALAVVWVVFLVQITSSTPFSLSQAVLAYVAFACARWGSAATIAASGASMPLAAALLAGLTLAGVDAPLAVVRPILGMAPPRSTYGLLASALFAAAVVLVVPWVAGLAARSAARARDSAASAVVAEQDARVAHREADQAREIAALRDEQARLARDVHDVVGHSLAVILAQAESAQYLPDDPAQLKQTLATVATTARGSLSEVRAVLDNVPAAASAPVSSTGDQLTALVEGVRATGREVAVEDTGRDRPLPPELAVVAERVLQEMLTNAVKHGSREHPIRVERHWPGGAYERDLRVEVSNAVSVQDPEPARPADTVPGRGLEGMARRLETVGGRFDVRRRELPGGATFTATAWIPVRAS